MGGILDSPRRKHFAGCLPIALLSTAGVLVIAALMTFIFDQQCHREAALLLQPYPNATLEASSFTFMRPHGVGVTQQQYFTPDDIAEVRKFYIDRALEAEAEAGVSLGTTLADIQRRFVDMRDGSGTRIQFMTECARPLDLSAIGITRAGTSTTETTDS